MEVTLAGTPVDAHDERVPAPARPRAARRPRARARQLLHLLHGTADRRSIARSMSSCRALRSKLELDAATRASSRPCAASGTCSPRTSHEARDAHDRGRRHPARAAGGDRSAIFRVHRTSAAVDPEEHIDPRSRRALTTDAAALQDAARAPQEQRVAVSIYSSDRALVATNVDPPLAPPPRRFGPGGDPEERAGGDLLHAIARAAVPRGTSAGHLTIAAIIR